MSISSRRSFAPAGAVLVLLGLGACSAKDDPPIRATAVDFEPGGDDDPVLALALTTNSTSSSAQITITNRTNYNFTEGLITFGPVFTVGQVASTALKNYVTSGAAGEGNATTLASALGLTLNSTAFKVGAIAKNATASVTITVPTGATIYYLAHVVGSTDDFVAVSGATLGGPATLYGYDLNDVGGAVTLGNGTTGSSTGTSTWTTTDLAACTGASAMTQVTTLLNDEFTNVVANWPVDAGYDADFNGDWSTDGTSARVYNPAATGGSGLPLGANTGFVKFMNICPTTGATISLEAQVDTSLYTNAASDTTLHVYYFDASNALLKIDFSYPLRKGSLRKIAVYDSQVPSNARRIAIVPMARIDAAEKSSVFYHSILATYEPRGTVTTTAVAADDFSTWTSPGNQPTGWAEFNGDWYVMTANKFITVWNPKWGGDQSKPPPVDTGVTKSFTLTGTQAGDRLDATMFAASTFTDPTSFVRLRLIFNNGTTIESDRTGGSTYHDVFLRRVAVPTGATSVMAVINVFLGANETSSLYVDDFKLNRVR